MADNPQKPRATPPPRVWEGGTQGTDAYDDPAGRGMVMSQLLHDFRLFLPKFEAFYDDTRERLTRLEGSVVNIEKLVAALPTKEDLAKKLDGNTFFATFFGGVGLLAVAIVWAAEKITDENHELVREMQSSSQVTIEREPSVEVEPVAKPKEKTVPDEEATSGEKES